MTMLPPDELWTLPDQFVVGTPVLELGNKKNSTGLYRNWYMDQGLHYECVDWNGLDGAYKYDMRIPDGWRQIILDLCEETRFPMVTNFGFTEHVGETLEEQLECWRNVHHLVRDYGYLCICMPLMPFWKGHGRWMPTPEWYYEFAEKNNYEMLKAKIWDRVRPTFCATLRKIGIDDFVAPTEAGIERSDL